jgi:probable F420-dependent oxidoreductase
MAKKFRFGIQTSKAASAMDWAQKARRIEELGFSSLFIPDHFGDQFAPLIALAAAANATSDLRLGTLVLDNDYRHPLLLAKEWATLDVLSDGRVEAGLGAGWMKSDYDESGMSYDEPKMRIDRFKEGLAIIKGLFASEGPFSFAGKFYNITNAQPLPRPVQKPHPPILIGAGAKRMTRVAARNADIVSVNFSLAEGVVNPTVAATGTAAATSEKVAWMKESAGSHFDELELSCTVFFTNVTDDRKGMAERIAGGFGMPADEVLRSPHVVIGTHEQVIDDLQQRREEFGFSYIVFSGDMHEQMAPVVKKLAGT